MTEWAMIAGAGFDQVGGAALVAVALLALGRSIRRGTR